MQATRYGEGIYLIVSDCKLAYVQARALVVERHNEPTVRFNFKSGKEADVIAQKINEDIRVNELRDRTLQGKGAPGPS